MIAAQQKELEKAIDFLTEIGIKVIEKDLPETTFLPGLELGSNIIYVDYKKLKYPGDILHEAGHIAVTSPAERLLIGTDEISETWPVQGEEIAAILWSFAVADHLGLPLEFIFHKDGYKGHSEWYIDNFKNGNYIGLPLLQWLKMAYSNDDIENQEKPAFPAMQHWMRMD